MTIPRVVAIAVAVGTFAIGVSRGTWAVGGSDSSCYGLMAQAFARGELQPRSPLVEDAPWPEAQRTFAPGGFIPSPVSADAASPICAPGFSLLLTPFYIIGGPDGIFFLTPLAGALLVYLTFLMGHHLVGEYVGLAAAIAVAAMPVFVFQLVQPMNDVTVALLWTAVLWTMWGGADRIGPTILAGALTGLAILVRPNLAPLAIVAAAWFVAIGWRRLVIFIAATTPFVAVLLTLNGWLYGHPLSTGYGDVADLFGARYLNENVMNYGLALWQSQRGFPLLGFAAPFVARRRQRREVGTGVLLASLVILVYLFYRPLPEWWYLRFLLPALPVLTVLAVATIAWVTRRAGAVAAVVGVVIAHALGSPAMQDGWDVGRLERRFRVAADVAKERLPPTAVFLTVWESGSVRFHAAREAVLWDSLPVNALDDSMTWLSTRGFEPYIMIEDWEEPLFRARFSSHSAIGHLDWPPRYEIERRVKVYRPADRAVFLKGQPIPREIVWADR